MKTVVHLLLLTLGLIAMGGVSAAPHDIHALQRDVAVLQAEQRDALAKASVENKLALQQALEGVDGKLDRLSIRFDELDKRVGGQVGDLSMYTAWFATLFSIVAVAIGFLTFVSGRERAEFTAKQWLAANGRQQINDTIEPQLRAQKALLEERFNAEIADLRGAMEEKANAALDEAKKRWQPPLGGPGRDAPDSPGDPGGGAPNAPSGAGSANIARPPPGTAVDYAAARAATLNAFNAGRFEQAFEAASQALRLAQTPLQQLQARRGCGATLFALGKLKEALQEYEQAALPFQPGDDAETTLELAKAHLGKALTLFAVNREQEATAVLSALVERFAAVNEGALGEVIAESLNNIAYGHYASGRYREAVTAADQLLSRFGTQSTIEFKRLLARVSLTRALALGATEGPERELDAYEQLRSSYQSSLDDEVREVVSFALYNTALAHERLGHRDAARSVYLLIDALYRGATRPDLAKTVRDARHRLRALDPPAERPTSATSDR